MRYLFKLCLNVKQFDSTHRKDLSGAINLGESRPETNGKEEVLRIHQTSNITRTSPSDCLMSYIEHSLGVESYPSAEKQSVYSTASGDWSVYLNGIIYIYIYIYSNSIIIIIIVIISRKKKTIFGYITIIIFFPILLRALIRIKDSEIILTGLHQINNFNRTSSDLMRKKF